IETVYNAIHAGNPSPELLAIKYLESLGRIANGQATKVFLPADFGAGLGSLGAIAELFKADDDPSARDERAQSGRAALEERRDQNGEERREDQARDLTKPHVPPPVIEMPDVPDVPDLPGRSGPGTPPPPPPT